MASIDIENASVSYLLHKTGLGREFKRGNVGAPINVGRRYIQVAALRNITLHLKDGDRVGLIGMNGSGKSTLLRLCAGALATQAGSIRVEGKVAPQFSLGAGLRPALSGRRNIELKSLYLGVPQRSIPERVEQVKEISGLGGYFELPISSYSAGMRSRLVMSMMKLMRADILIMDEWIGAADATVSTTVSSLQTDLIENSSILLMASHSERILASWVNRLVWLDQGTIRAEGSYDDVLREYNAWILASMPHEAERRRMVRDRKRRRIRARKKALARALKAPQPTDKPPGAI